MEQSWTRNPSPANNPCSQGEYLDGWYPSLMSLDAKPGHLTTQGYVFYMDGCISDKGRTFSTRTFAINVR